ncbi:MAG: hypothetical protein HN712_02445, partial [Gemmatimonadetes bacterium]|nr:hypothetical protein [Gemmatimonadota bacterium]
MSFRYLLLAAVILFLVPQADAQDPCDFNADGVVDQFEADTCGDPPDPVDGDPCDTDGDGFVDDLEAGACGEPAPPFEEWQIGPD